MYLGWWCQCYLREKYMERVKHHVARDPTSSQVHKRDHVDLSRQRPVGTVRSSEVSTLYNLRSSSGECRLAIWAIMCRN